MVARKIKTKQEDKTKAFNYLKKAEDNHTQMLAALRDENFGASFINYCYLAEILINFSIWTRVLKNMKNHQRNISNVVKISRKLSCFFANPACIAGVLISSPNFKAECGLMKL